MKNVVGVKFSKKSRIYYFDSGEFHLKLNDEIIVETERGLQYGFVTKVNQEIKEKDILSSLKPVIRIATSYDKKQYSKNMRDSNFAYLKAKQLAEKLDLKMNIIDANYTFDRKQLLFNFLSDERVDFREFAKQLASIYKTRIELRQIGIRDKAREVGGLGPCGRFLCCNLFLTDINSVTINMAKNQMLSLNPTKINGVCGRLLCCLAYEDDIYSEYKAGLPNIGDSYFYNKENYKVIDVNVLKRKIKISNDNQVEEITL